MMGVDENGIALISLIILIALFGLLAAGVVGMLVQDSASHVVELNRARAFYLAEAGLNDSFWEIKYEEKLYGPPSEAYGVISERDVSFEGGITGTYRAVDSTGVIESSGSAGGVERDLRQSYNSAGKSYVLYRYGAAGPLNVLMHAQITGNVFNNGSVVVNNPASIDSNSVDLYLPSGESANYSGGQFFPFETISPIPDQPILNTS
ncbi:hypothetical protein J7M07_02690, partial [bacterium]|nr:hypothetical protein [bacterium]